MKFKSKTILIITVLLVLALLFASTLPLEIVPSRYDVNDDGEINMKDAALVWSHRGTTVQEEIDLYDILVDGKVDMKDAAFIWSQRGNTPGEEICGNGICDEGETWETCPDDCPEPVCGNGICEYGETVENCPEDCSSGTILDWLQDLIWS